MTEIQPLVGLSFDLSSSGAIASDTYNQRR